ncbi:MAG: hypothetical protein DRP01_00605 [Archaeoglobales archaeon]|nr:MAG: hypothetical protein DRP01_00605 [Archaeoglobales archaeon]
MERLSNSKRAYVKAKDLLHDVAPVFAEHLTELAISYLLAFPSRCIKLVYEALEGEPEEIKDTVAEYICYNTKNLKKFMEAIEIAALSSYEYKDFEWALELESTEFVENLARKIRHLI